MNRSRRTQPAVRLDGAGKRYGDAWALEPLDLVIPAGEAVAVVGHNGSGKSTLLGCIVGVLEPTAGTVSVFGRPPDDVGARARSSFLPDAPVLYDDLSVREHVQYVARLHGGRGDDPWHDELLQRLGLADRADQLPSQFSRGLRQKTAIAVALCRPFQLLVVDEPFVGLDAAGRATLLELLGEAVVDGATVLVATHEAAVLELFDRCLVLVDGAVSYDGPPPPPTS